MDIMPICGDEATHDDLTLGLLDTSPQVLAPPLNDNLNYHAFMLYHASDQEWAHTVISKLESPALGFKCCVQSRNMQGAFTLPQALLQGMKNSLKVVITLTPEFVRNNWPSCEPLFKDMDFITLQKDLVLLMLRDCDIPSCMAHVGYIRTSKHGWWTKFLARLALPDDTPMTEETVLSMSCSMASSLVGLTPGLQSGHLLSSLKSECGCCGLERVDAAQVPDELLAHGVQIPPDEYCSAVRQLMSEAKFRCHMWCYNLPLLLVFWIALLALCLTLFPALEARFITAPMQQGMEYLHGTVAWLCCLTLYMFTNHIARGKMKQTMYKRIAKTNTVFIRYNILIGVEHLGIADCNKYYLHFFYYEIGPCLAYLQEILGTLETQHSYLNYMASDMDLECGDALGASDQITVLNGDVVTNSAMQDEAEDMLLQYSGEYIYRLITKKLDKPQHQRHVRGAFCLCQYIEHRVYKLVV